MRYSIRTIKFFATAILICGTLFHSVAQEDVASIIRRVEANQVSDTGKMEATLEVSTRFGVTKSTFLSYSRKGGDALIEVTTGPDRGQKILRQENNIYLYYPDAEEVIWLKGSALKDSMMGSDFSYEDLTNDKTILDRYNAELIGNEAIDGTDCYHIILTAKTRNETYAKEEIWVDTSRFVTRRALLYSAAGKAIREMTTNDVRAVSGRQIAFSTVMKDLLKKNTSTTMTISNAEFDLPLSEKYFNREELSW